MEYRTIGRAEMKPNVYGGKDCETHIPQWESYFEGDKESEICDTLDYYSKYFVPGTKIIIMEPVCPECEHIASICDCGFDWKTWTEGEYC